VTDCCRRTQCTLLPFDSVLGPNTSCYWVCGDTVPRKVGSIADLIWNIYLYVDSFTAVCTISVQDYVSLETPRLLSHWNQKRLKTTLRNLVLTIMGSGYAGEIYVDSFTAVSTFSVQDYVLLEPPSLLSQWNQKRLKRS